MRSVLLLALVAAACATPRPAPITLQSCKVACPDEAYEDKDHTTKTELACVYVLYPGAGCLLICFCASIPSDHSKKYCYYNVRNVAHLCFH